MAAPVPGQFVKLRRRVGRVLSVSSHHGDQDGLIKMRGLFLNSLLHFYLRKKFLAMPSVLIMKLI